MRQIDILLTNPLEGGHDPFAHGDLKVVFHPWHGAGPLPLLDGRPWAFVDWLLPELSGLELCRRLRADMQTEAAHVTMVLERMTRRPSAARCAPERMTISLARSTAARCWTACSRCNCPSARRWRARCDWAN